MCQENTYRPGNPACHLFSIVLEPRVLFTFLSCSNKKVKCFVTHENYRKLKFLFMNEWSIIGMQWHIHYLWLLWATVAELSNCDDRDCIACKTEKIYCLALCRKCLSSPGLCVWSREAAGVSMVTCGVFSYLGSCVVNSSAKIFNLVLKTWASCRVGCHGNCSANHVLSETFRTDEDIDGQRIRWSSWVC